MALLKYIDKSDKKWKPLSIISQNSGVAVDLEVSEVNDKTNLHLVDADGVRVGEGISVDEISGDNDIILDDDIITDP